MKMKVICAWCLKPVGQKECQHPDCADAQLQVSQGICDECKEKVLASIEKVLAQEIQPT